MFRGDVRDARRRACGVEGRSLRSCSISPRSRSCAPRWWTRPATCAITCSAPRTCSRPPATPRVVDVTSDMCYAHGDGPAPRGRPARRTEPYSASKAARSLWGGPPRVARRARGDRPRGQRVRRRRLGAGPAAARPRPCPESGAPSCCAARAVRPWQHVLGPLAGYLHSPSAWPGRPTSHRVELRPGQRRRAPCAARRPRSRALAVDVRIEPGNSRRGAGAAVDASAARVRLEWLRRTPRSGLDATLDWPTSCAPEPTRAPSLCWQIAAAGRGC